MSTAFPSQSSAELCGATQFDLLSKSSGRTYRLYVAKPIAPAPPTGYPVVIITDGNALFATAAMQMTFRQFGELRPAIIVGVGYPVDDLFQSIALRTRDLTPPTPAGKIPGYLKSGPLFHGCTFGGAEPFYRFLTEELLPMIAEGYPIDRGDQTLYGDSLGGLFTLHVLFNHPEAFRTFVAASPSIWWNNCAVLDDEASFRNRVEVETHAPRVYLTVGGLEQSIANLQPPPGFSHETMVKLITDARMVDNARELADRLSAIKAPHGCLVRFHAFEGETHDSALPASVSRGLGFALA